MTLDRSNPAPTAIRRESRASLFGAALMLGIGAIVIASGLVLIGAAILLGDTAFDLP
ncbi:hypothetical protein ACFPER_09030 [Agromyces aurantiacus]|uniref:Phosphate ABC transporter permease subunit PstC n=1 Tax=Agromyces aurantiacus TaxID=165814 RepID=A0ABV9R613_9MICO|nr:hypothetical protein [Agromyces aurantiacus]MBM7503614.1 hypothetical protein [Agromyces aurantiacus]